MGRVAEEARHELKISPLASADALLAGSSTTGASRLSDWRRSALPGAILPYVPLWVGSSSAPTHHRYAARANCYFCSTIPWTIQYK